MESFNNDTYSVQRGHSIFDKATLSARRKMYGVLCRNFPIENVQSILDVGVTADWEQESSNYFENFYPHSGRITAFSNQDAGWMEKAYGGLRFVKGNALDMPFEDKTFDLVFSSAVIEHVGSRENQRRFMEECIRVSKKYIFITTPNRLYPVELHTVIPFLHWMSPEKYRATLTKMNKHFFADENNLNLLDEKELIGITSAFRESVDFETRHIRFLGFKSNILLLATRRDEV